MTTPKSSAILFTTGHNEELSLNEPELSQLEKLLKMNGMEPHTLNTPLATENLSKFQAIVLGNPRDSIFNPQEVTNLVSFVESGGGLLLVSGATIFGKGGDAARNTNLNEIAKQFRFEFSNKALGEPIDTSTELIVAAPAREHPTVAGISNLVLTSGVSLIAEDAESYLFRVTNSTGSPIIAIATKAKKGRVMAFGGGAFFFNDYIETGDHDQLIVQAFRWLSGEPMNRSIKRLSTPPLILDEASASEAISDLRQQLNKMEEELSRLKEVITTSVKDMEKLMRQIQEKEEP